MFGFYSPLLILQAFCLYHAYRNNAEQRWYWLIFFIPGIGCLLYLYHAFYSRNQVQNLTQGMKGMINKNYRVEQLERTLRFADNVTNKINLADAYVGVARYDEAIPLYNACLQSIMAGDINLRMKLLQVHYLKGDYDTAIQYGVQLEAEKQKVYRSSEARVAYAWALYHSDQVSQAQEIFKDLDRPYTHYWHRLEYAKFLKETGQTEEMNERLTQLLEEFEYIKGPERKLYRQIMSEARSLYRNQTAKVKA